MKTIIPALTLLATIFTVFACKQPRYAAENLPEKRIYWGSGGGYTGRETNYLLLENGQMFIQTHETGDSVAEIAGTKPKLAGQIFKTAESLRLGEVDFQHPGNIYSFVGVMKNNAVHRITWGERNMPVDPNIQDLYRQLSDLVKK